MGAAVLWLSAVLIGCAVAIILVVQRAIDAIDRVHSAVRDVDRSVHAVLRVKASVPP